MEVQYYAALDEDDMSQFLSDNWFFIVMVFVIFWFVVVHLMDGVPDDILSVFWKRMRDARKERPHGGVRDHR